MHSMVGVFRCCPQLQSKKEAEEQRQRELNELFAEAIKQPKVPVGELFIFCNVQRRSSFSDCHTHTVPCLDKLSRGR